MNTKKSLIIGRGIFTLFVIIAFGTIIMNEKGAELFAPKIKSKITTYLTSNYSDIVNKLEINDIKYQNKEFIAKIISKSNNNHLFYIKYNNGKITDTYKKDYLEGKKLLTTLSKNLEKEIHEKTKKTCTIHFIMPLNEYSSTVQDNILKGKDLSSLKIYYIEKELLIYDWSKETITKEIVDFINTMTDYKITPKYYEITITDNEDITKSITINNITEGFTNNKNNQLIINDIITDNNSALLKENKITYKILN